MTICLYGEVDCQASSGLIAVGERLFYLADDGEHGREVWVSDGSPAGTHMVKDIFPGETGFPACQYCTWSRSAYGERLFFQASDGLGTYTLWTSDGTDADTRPVMEFDGNISFGDFNSLPLLLVSSSGGEQVWKTDGTTAGTTLLTTIPVTGSERLYTFSDESYFYLLFKVPASGEARPYTGILWRTDGTPAGTIWLADIPHMWALSNQVNMNGVMYWISDYNYDGGGPFHWMRVTLWRSDGTVEGTEIVKVWDTPGVIPIVNLVTMNDLLFFVARHETEGYIMWQSDGTPLGTEPIQLSDNPTLPQGLPVLRNQLYFYSPSPREALYRTVGKSSGIQWFSDVSLNDPASWWLPFVVGDSLYYTNGVDGGYDPWWRTDGMEIFPLMDESAPYTGPIFQIALDPGFLFTAVTPETGRELWITYGSPSSTRLLADLIPGAASSAPAEFTRVGRKVFFTLVEGNRDQGLWVADVAISKTCLYLPSIYR